MNLKASLAIPAFMLGAAMWLTTSLAANAVVVMLPNADFPSSPMFSIDCPGCLFHDGTVDGTGGSIINNDDLKNLPITGGGDGVSLADEVAYYNDTKGMGVPDASATPVKSTTSGDGGAFGPDDQNIMFFTDSSAIFFRNDGPAGYSVFLYNPNDTIKVSYSGSGMAAGLSHFVTETTPAPVPIPAALPLFLSGLVTLSLVARRPRSQIKIRN